MELSPGDKCEIQPIGIDDDMLVAPDEDVKATSGIFGGAFFPGSANSVTGSIHSAFSGAKGIGKDFRNRIDQMYAVSAGSPFLIHPQENIKFSRRWDLVIAFLLVITATVTPYEVGFLAMKMNGLFFFNRIVDILFFVDMCFNFVTAYKNPKTGEWITSHGRIAKHYASSWFTLDLVSTIPFDWIAEILAASGSLSSLKVLRILRILKLAKLLRVLRAGRMFERIESTMRIDYSSLSLLSFLIITLVGTHWLACGFSLITKWDTDSMSWIKALFGDGEDDDLSVSAVEKYVAAMYWSAMTISTIGYGDIVPTTVLERIYVTICMLYGALLYGYIIGAVSGIVAARDEAKNRFYSTMDQLNEYMEVMRLDDNLVRRLREYFSNKFNKQDNSSYKELLHMMSPALQAEVAAMNNSQWVRNIRFLKGLPDATVDHLTVMLGLQMEYMLYPKSEHIIQKDQELYHLRMVQNGTIMQGGRVMTSGSVFGVECLLGEDVRSTFTCVAITYSMIGSVSADICLQILSKYPGAMRLLQNSRIWNIAKKEVIAYSKARKICDEEIAQARAQASSSGWVAAYAVTDGSSTGKARRQSGSFTSRATRHGGHARLSRIVLVEAEVEEETIEPRVLHYLRKLRDISFVSDHEAKLSFQAIIRLQRAYRKFKERKMKRSMFGVSTIPRAFLQDFTADQDKETWQLHAINQLRLNQEHMFRQQDEILKVVGFLRRREMTHVEREQMGYFG